MLRRTLLLGILGLSGCSAPVAEGITWAKDLASARSQAAQEDRPLVLYFTYDT